MEVSVKPVSNSQGMASIEFLNGYLGDKKLGKNAVWKNEDADMFIKEVNKEKTNNNIKTGIAGVVAFAATLAIPKCKGILGIIVSVLAGGLAAFGTGKYLDNKITNSFSKKFDEICTKNNTKPSPYI